MLRKAYRNISAMLAVLLLITIVDAAAWNNKPAAVNIDGAATDRILVKIADDMETVRSHSVLNDSVTGMSELFRLPATVSALGSDGTGSGGAAWYVASLEDGVDLLSVREELLKSERVLAVEFDYVRTLSQPIPVEAADPFEARQEYLEYIGAYDAYERIQNSEQPGYGIVVAVLDTGVDDKHPDMDSNISIGGRRYYVSAMGDVAWDTDYKDKNGHGTHVAGIIAATRNGSRVVGVASGAVVLPVKVLNDAGSGYDSAIAAGIDYAISRSARVINMSFGGMWGKELYTDLAIKARESNCLIVAAAGNDALPTSVIDGSYYSDQISPANIPQVLSVMAMNMTPADNGDYLASYSNWNSNPLEGAEYQIMAPGEALSSYSSGRYTVISGTSVAAPIVSGAAAVLIGNQLDITVEEVWDKLVSGGIPTQGKTVDGKTYTYSALNLNTSLDFARAEPSLSARVKTELNQEVMVGGVSMSLDSIDTAGMIVVDDRGKVLSDITLSITNYSGRAQDIRVASDVLDCEQDVEVLGIGDSSDIVLTVRGLVTGDSLTCELKVKYKNIEGVELEPLVLDVKIPVLRVRLPQGLVWNSHGWYTFADTSALVLNPGTLWCLPKTLRVGKGQSMTLTPGAELYIAGQAEIIVENGKFEVSGKADAPATIYSNCAIKNLGGQVSINYAVLYEPFIEGATRINNSYIEGSPPEVYEESVELPDELEDGESPPEEPGENEESPEEPGENGELPEELGENEESPEESSENEASSDESGKDGVARKKPYRIEADSIWRTEIADLWDADIIARDFAENLVDSCVDTRLTSNRITHNSFRENLLICPELYGYHENMCLVIITPDYNGENEGFYSNCVVGPIKVYSERTEEDFQYAAIADIYYQGIGALAWGTFAILTDTDDRIFCAPESKNIGGEVITGCPPFAVGLTVEGNEYESELRRVVTRLRIDFSGKMDAESDIYCLALDNPLYYTGKPLPDTIEWAEDGKSCTLEIYAGANNAMNVNYYLFSGFIPADYPLMRHGIFSTFNVPVTVRFVEEMTVYSRDIVEGVVLEWMPPRHEDFTNYSVSRSLDGESFVEIYSNELHRFAKNGDKYRFIDIDADKNIHYYYQIDGFTVNEFGDKRRVAMGYTDIIRSAGAPSLDFVKSDVNLKGRGVKVLTLYADNVLEFDELSFDIVYDGKLLTVLDVSDELWNIYGLPYGVTQVDGNTIRIQAGPDITRAKVTAGQTLANITVRGSNIDGDSAVSIENLVAKREGEELELGSGLNCRILTIARPEAEEVSVTRGDDGTRVTQYSISNGSRAEITHWADGDISVNVTAPARAGRFTAAFPLEGGSDTSVLALMPDGGLLPVPMSLYEQGIFYVSLTESTRLVVTRPDLDFKDMEDDHWSSEAVDFVIGHGFYTGMDIDDFAPDAQMTRAMLVTVLHRLAGTPPIGKPSGFQDIEPGVYYEDAVNWAIEKGIIDGDSDAFMPDDLITRENLAVMLWSFARSYDAVDVEGTADLEKFLDYENISEWALEPMSWAVGADLIRGRGGLQIVPDAVSTRAEVAVVIHRFVSWLV